jgi:dCTP deaminase
LILTDREIKNSLDAGLLVIDPRPAPIAFASTSVDLTLAGSIRIFKTTQTGVESVIDPMAKDYSVIKVLEGLTDRAEIDPSRGFDLDRNQLVLAWTKEKVELRERGRVAARVEGKSSLARIGLAIHVTAPTIHAGFVGLIQLEIVNHGPLPIRLRIGMPICQLIFEQTLGMPDRAYQGQFSGQSS